MQHLTGDSLPVLLTPVPGPLSRGWVDRLARRECPAITARRGRRAASLGLADDDPIVWEQALGANVVDADGNIFVDMTSGFGVASVGHRNPAVVAAGVAQLGRLVSAMGDAYPDPQRVLLMERLCALTGLDRVIFGSSGSDAVEAALKTARVATGRDGILAFEGAYHGLSYGALAESHYKHSDFRAPFQGQLGAHVRHAPFGGDLPSKAELAAVGAIIVEPIQGRGGMRVPPKGWLLALRDLAYDAGALLIFDEIYTGFGRTGQLFAFQHEDVLPDLLCLGKGMAGGFPLSACLGTAAAMDAWGASKGEALHTQTFLGHPVGCAMALAAIDEVLCLLPGVGARSEALVAACGARGLSVRGRGLLLGVTVPDPLAASRGLLSRGYLALPAGEADPVLAVVPPLCVAQTQLDGFMAALDEVLG